MERTLDLASRLYTGIKLSILVPSGQVSIVMWRIYGTGLIDMDSLVIVKWVTCWKGWAGSEVGRIRLGWLPGGSGTLLKIR
jgi:hypothetical protein